MPAASGRRGKIVNVISLREAMPGPEHAAYGGDRDGLLTLTRGLALELAPDGINVNAIAPGLIRRPLTQHRTDDPETRRKELPNIPWRGPAGPKRWRGLRPIWRRRNRTISPTRV